ncbi:MAG: Flp pilus assembly complex ATPase component TadA [Candidatus Marsarchaeota archaeon]|nr:Flp pilus assembly complex ATPase component TadA [Candidatus Marsarchaeota archaeon]
MEDDKADTGHGTALESYSFDVKGLKVSVEITNEGGYVPAYKVTYPGIGDATRVLLLSLRPELLSLVPIDQTRVADQKYAAELETSYETAAIPIIERYLPGTSQESMKTLIAYLINMLLGLGDIEVVSNDENLEEIAVNNAAEPVWVFHKVHGWCKSNVKLNSEENIYQISEQIGRRVGREINNLVPMMDAELPDGSRVNATLFPISQHGNTITIRKFAKNPWSMPAMIANKTISGDIAGMIWLAIQNEISMLISGGTASGKTSFLNAMSIFMPANRRIISVEETRELTLPGFLQWLPMQTRQANPEGKGAISLYDLMINALRQRPDIMLIGEIRVKSDAETLFEAIHTGHAVYGTVHADSAHDTIIRMTNPPIAIPKILMSAIGAITSLFRHRRLGIRRLFEFGEITNDGDVSVVKRWNMRSDTFADGAELSRLMQTISLYSGFTQAEIKEDIEKKSVILEWMVRNKVFDVDECGNIVAHYYKDEDEVFEIAKGDKPYSKSMFS